MRDREVIKENRIKCKKFKEEFGAKNNHFKSNETLSQLIESQSYLCEEETSLKHELEVSLQKFFEFYDAFIQNRTQLESDVFDHFQEIRFQIDQHREELKKRIDEISLSMIDETNKYQEKYLRELKESFSLFDETQSLEDKLNELEETFRNPNILIQSIKDMQQKQEESLRDIQSKLKELNQVKDHLIATDYFKPNLIPFNPNKTSCFGLIKLNGYWLNTNSQTNEADIFLAGTFNFQLDEK